MGLDFRLRNKPRECRDDDEAVETVGKRYFTIWDFMLFDFKLEKTELYVYAIIFAMHKNYHTYFQGSREYLAKWTNSSIRTISDVLKSLTDKGLIVKAHKDFNNGRRAVYYVNEDCLPECEFFEYENKNKRLKEIIRKANEAKGIKTDGAIIFSEDDEFEYGFPIVEDAYDFTTRDPAKRT